MEEKNYHTMNLEEIYQSLQTSKDGLSMKEAKKRLLKYGPNLLPKKEKDNLFLIFFKDYEYCS